MSLSEWWFDFTSSFDCSGRRWKRFCKMIICSHCFESIHLYLFFLVIPFVLNMLWILIPLVDVDQYQIYLNNHTNNHNSTVAHGVLVFHPVKDLIWTESPFLLTTTLNDTNNNLNLTNSTSNGPKFDSFIGLGASYYLYYLYAFLIWLVFYDYVMPMNSKWVIFLSSILFTLFAITSLVIIYYCKIADSRWSYLMLAGSEVLTGFFAYAICVVWMLLKRRSGKTTVKQRLREEGMANIPEKFTRVDEVQVVGPSGKFILHNKYYSDSSNNLTEQERDMLRKNISGGTDLGVSLLQEEDNVQYYHEEFQNNEKEVLYHDIEFPRGWTEGFIRTCCCQSWLFDFQSHYTEPYAYRTQVEENYRWFKRRKRQWEDHTTEENFNNYLTSEIIKLEDGKTFPAVTIDLGSVSSKSTDFIHEPTPSNMSYKVLEQKSREKPSLDITTSSFHAVKVEKTTNYLLKTLFSVIIFKLLVFLIWFYLQSFATEIWLKTPPHLQVAVSILFQVSRVIISFILELASDILLPTNSVEAIRFFHVFISQMFFSLFYSYLFVEVARWDNFILMQFINLIFLIAQYPVRTTKLFHKVLTKLKYWILYLLGIKKLLPKQFQKITSKTYERHLQNIAASFYLYEISTFTSIFAFLIYVNVLRSSDYNFQMYPLLKDRYSINSTYSISITQQSMVLLVLEFVFIMVCNFMSFMVTGKNLSHMGRKLTIEDDKTRFLYSLFMLHFLNDIHYFMQRPFSYSAY